MLIFLKIKEVFTSQWFYLLLLGNSLITKTSLAYDFEDNSGIGETAYKAGYQEANLTDKTLVGTIGIVIKTFILFIGVFFLLLMIYAGFVWMLSRGNEQDIEKAKTTMQNASIGLVIVVLAYVITYLVASVMSSPPI